MSGPISRISRLLAGALTQMDKGPAYFQVKEASVTQRRNSRIS
jgi:hypothetical protein